MRRALLVLAVLALAGCAASEQTEPSWVASWEKKGDLAGFVSVLEAQGWTRDATNSSPEVPVLRLERPNATLRADAAEGQILVGERVHDMFRLDVWALGSTVECAKDAEPFLRPHLEPTLAALQAEYGPPLGSDFHSTDTGRRCHP